jgi:hypothetical protein
MRAPDPIDAVPGLDHPAVQLFVALTCDFIGMLGYLLPVIGELGDIVWAPVQAIILYAMVGRERMGLLFVGGGFLEEILPWTDFVPSVTLAWLYKFVRR